MPVGGRVHERALLPALLGNLELGATACPDVAINGSGGESGCADQRVASPVPTASATSPMTSTAPIATPKASTASAPKYTK
ncbi:hypothetical protein GGF38_004877, partial [Coemansia sp. RSA 25]